MAREVFKVGEAFLWLFLVKGMNPQYKGLGNKSNAKTWWSLAPCGKSWWSIGAYSAMVPAPLDAVVKRIALYSIYDVIHNR